MRLLAAINRAVLTNDYYGGNFGRLLVSYGLQLVRLTIHKRRVCDMAGICLGLAALVMIARRAARIGEWVPHWLGTGGDQTQSEGGVEIRVGKQAKDNDVLSTDPAHRDNDDWWLHASGCPGSHVVIRHETVSGSSLPREVELDAAVLAANYSKAAKSGTVPVNICKARQVSKPAGAKPGLVQLSGDVKTIKVNWKNEKRRLDRLSSDAAAAEEDAASSSS